MLVFGLLDKVYLLHNIDIQKHTDRQTSHISFLLVHMRQPSHTGILLRAIPFKKLLGGVCARLFGPPRGDIGK